MNETIPWVEKYRPKYLDNIILNDYNKMILNNVISKRHFPNLLFYGPPGTGKTTTMVSLISAYQEGIVMKKGLCIHLNASDERGIDTIRYQISNFVNSKGLFNDGLKFIILDEVDYMTKSAQHGLKYLIENSRDNVRYCLICNYISKIEHTLQNNFLKLKFNKLPGNNIIELLDNISVNEKLHLSREKLESIQEYYESDIRSMINYIQTNNKNINIINKNLCKNFIKKGDKLKVVLKKINSISVDYNIDKYSIIKEYIRNIVINKKYELNNDLLNSLETIFRNIDTCNDNNLSYIILKLLSLEEQ